MKIALCLSGHVRNLKQNFLNLKHFILTPYQPDVFISTWDTFGFRAEGNDIDLLPGGFKGFDHYSGKINKNEIITLLNPKKIEIENFLDKQIEFNEIANRHKPNCGHPLDRPINTVSMAYKLLKCNNLKQNFEKENNFEYDVVIRSRPDMIYGNQLLTNHVLTLIQNDYLLTAEAHSYGTASDIFAIGKTKIIDLYSDLYNHLDYINDSGCNMNPHHVLKFYFDLKFQTKWAKYPFAIDLNRCRKQCGNQLSCGDCDPGKKILTNKFEE